MLKKNNFAGRYIHHDELEKIIARAVKAEKETWIIKMLEIRDALMKNTTDKSFNISNAYHIIYGLASPEFAQYHPWKEWEKIRARRK